MAIGTVKWFNDRLGYGFIIQEDGPEIFVHCSDIDMEGINSLQEGARVKYEIELGQTGPAAVNVTVVEGKPA